MSRCPCGVMSEDPSHHDHFCPVRSEWRKGLLAGITSSVPDDQYVYVSDLTPVTQLKHQVDEIRDDLRSTE